MNHKVQSVQNLYEDASTLLKRVVMGSEDSSADAIINNLTTGINTLKGCWEGKDAGVQINNVVTVLNGMVSVRNALVGLAVDSSKIASNYREIQNSNGAGLEALPALVGDEKARMAEYTDNRDTVGITPQANEGKARVDAANEAIQGFIVNVQQYYDKIMQNWTAGTGRDKATSAFDAFMSMSKKYREMLAEVSSSIATAVQNYNF